MEMHVGAVQAGERALIIDDLVATGGTLSAAIRLLGSSILYKNSQKLTHFSPLCNIICKCVAMSEP